MRSNSKKSFGVLILVVIALVASVWSFMALGVNGFGPYRTVDNAEIISKHVDISTSEDSRETHYMVTTSAGTFEVDNGILLGTWNADEIYGSLRVGDTYELRTKGNKVVGMFFQEYPYIVSAMKVQKDLEEEDAGR